MPVVATLHLAESSGAFQFWGTLIYQYLSAGATVTARVISSGLSLPGIAVALDVDHPIEETTVAGPGLAAPLSSRWLQIALPAPITDIIDAAGVAIVAFNLAISNTKPFQPDKAFNDQAALDLTKDLRLLQRRGLDEEL